MKDTNEIKSYVLKIYDFARAIYSYDEEENCSGISSTMSEEIIFYAEQILDLLK